MPSKLNPNIRKKILDLALGFHCRYCGLPDEKGDYKSKKCYGDSQELADQIIQLIIQSLEGMNKLPPSAEVLEEDFKKNEGNVSRSDIWESYLHQSEQYNEAISDAIKLLKREH